jgi:hypothetical protein
MVPETLRILGFMESKPVYLDSEMELSSTLKMLELPVMKANEKF